MAMANLQQVSNQNQFSAVKQGLMLAQKAGYCTYLNQPNATNVLLVSLSQTCLVEQLLYNIV
jgi:hypothetical protein